MHILFISDNFPPEINAPASRTFEHCREWVAFGNNVTVITCTPNFPKGKVYAGYHNKPYQVEYMAGIRVIRVWTYIAANSGTKKRVLDYLSFMVSSIVAGIFIKKVDVIIGTSPQFFTACSAYVLSILKKKPWIFELRDIWPESIHTVGAIKNSRAINILTMLELFLYRRATRIISVTHSFKKILIQRGIQEDKIFVVTNGVDLNFFTRPDEPKDLILHHKLNGKFIAGYIGTHGMAHGLETLLDAAKILQERYPEEDLHILMVGDGAEKAALIDRSSNEALQNVTLLGSVSKTDVTRYLSLLDVSIIHLKNSPLFRAVIPSKMFESMAMGIPIAHGVLGESAEIVTDEAVGIVFEPGDAEALVNTLLKLKQNPALMKTYRRNGIRAAKRYNRRQLAKDMLEIIGDFESP